MPQFYKFNSINIQFYIVDELKYFLMWVWNIFVFLGPVIRNWSCFKYPTDSNWLDLTDWKGWRISVKKLTDFIWIDMNCLFRYPSKKIPILSEITKCQPLLYLKYIKCFNVWVWCVCCAATVDKDKTRKVGN